MGALSWPHILIVALVVFLPFGKGKVSELMGRCRSRHQELREGSRR